MVTVELCFLCVCLLCVDARREVVCAPYFMPCRVL